MQPQFFDDRQTCPLAFAAQLPQRLIAGPQALFEVPGWQTPFVDAEQQPDWQVTEAEQAFTHSWVTVSQELEVPGQLASELHPH